MMERLEKFQIIFNNPSATYCAGDTVYGYGWVVVKEAVYVQSKFFFFIMAIFTLCFLKYLLSGEG